MNDSDLVRGFFASLRWELSCVGWFVQVPLVMGFPDWSWTIRTVVAIAVLARALVFVFVAGPNESLRKYFWAASLAVDLTIKGLTISGVYPNHSGAYSIFYFGLTYLWTGGLIMVRSSGLDVRPTFAPLAFVLDFRLPGTHALTAFTDFWFLYLATWWAVISLNAFLRRSEQDLLDASRRGGLYQSVRSAVDFLAQQSSAHSVDCRVPSQRAPEPPIPSVSDELLLLIRRRSLRHQFTEWRARDPLVESTRLPRDDHDRLSRWMDLYLASEPSPLSLRLTTRGDHLHLSTKASHSAMSPHDLPDIGAGRSELINTSFGRVVSIRAPLFTADEQPPTHNVEEIAGADGAEEASVRYLNDIVGGGVAGDNYRFGRTLVWIMALYPLSVGAQQGFLMHPPGRAEHSAPWLRAICFAALSLIGLAAVVSVRKKEAVTTRRSWLLSLYLAYAAVVLAFALLDHANSFWVVPTHGWRYVHPFFGFGLLLSALISIWLAHAPMPFARALRRPMIAETDLDQPAAGRSAVATVVAAVSVVLPVLVAVATAGLKSSRFEVWNYVEQIGLWLGPSVVMVLVSYLLLRPLFNVLGDEAFAFEAGIPPRRDVGIGAGFACVADCPLETGRLQIAGAWNQPSSMVPVAASLLVGQIAVTVQSNGPLLEIVSSLAAADLLHVIGVLDRVLLLEGHGPADVTTEGQGVCIVRFEAMSRSRASAALRRVLLSNQSWVRDRDRWLMTNSHERV